MKFSSCLALAILGMPGLCYSQTKDLADYLPCQASGLKIAQADRLPVRPMIRTVKTAEGDKPITMVDGWRVLYLLLPTEPMLNLKFEELEATNWDQQKTWLIDWLRQLAKDDSNSQELHEKTFGQIHRYTVERKSLEGGVLSISELFKDSSYDVMTVYYLNDEPAKRQFQSIEELSCATESSETWEAAWMRERSKQSLISSQRGDLRVAYLVFLQLHPHLNDSIP